MNNKRVDFCDDDSKLCALVRRLAGLKQEGSYWDFKREWHGNNASLLHDIISLANNVNGDTAYLIIGIDEENDYCPYDIGEHCENRKNTQQVISVLRSAHWADAHPPVQVKTLIIGGCSVDIVIIVPDREAVPYYLMRDKRDGDVTVRAGAIYARDGDSNTPLNGTASALDTVKLWRCRFGLDRTPRERLPLLLADHESWLETKGMVDKEEYSREVYAAAQYHSQYPEFVFTEHMRVENTVRFYYMLTIPFNQLIWCTIRCFYHQTLLYEGSGIYFNNYYAAAPRLETIECPKASDFESDINYGYYIENSMDEVIEKYVLSKSKGVQSARDSLLKAVLVFHSEEEKTGFEDYVLNNWSLFESGKRSVSMSVFKPQVIPDRFSFSKDIYELFEIEVINAAALVDLLREYRNEQRKFFS